MEYCLYVTIQYWLSSFVVVTMAVVLEELLPAVDVVVVACMLLLSVYYFLYLPVAFLRPRYSTGRLRILCSYATMFAGQIVLLFGGLYIWFRLFPPFANFRDF